MKKREINQFVSIEIISIEGKEKWYKIREGYWQKVNSSRVLREESLVVYINQLKKLTGKIIIKGKR